MMLRFSAIRFSPDMHPEYGTLKSKDPSSHNTEHAVVFSTANQDIVSIARQAEGSKTDVEFRKDKGGFNAVLTTPDGLTMIALPGSKIKLADTEVQLLGNPITGSISEPLLPDTQTPPQQVTKQAMILGAGIASRFVPVAGDHTEKSKPGVPALGKRTISRLIGEHLKKHGMTEISSNTFYKPESVKQSLTEIAGVTPKFIDETAPSGTAGGLVKALQQGLIDETKPLLIIQGDAVTNADLSFLINSHDQYKPLVTIAVQTVADEDVNKFGILATDRSGDDKESGYVQFFMEKPSLEQAGNHRLGSTGFYVLSPEVFPIIKTMGEAMFKNGQQIDYAKDIFPALLKAAEGTDKKPIRAQKIGGYWADIGNPTQYVATAKDLYEGRVGLPLPKNLKKYYDKGAIYWPGAKGKAAVQEAEIEGNVIVTPTPKNRLQVQG